jgi:asparagine synthase (glutamine-hydrolysing)
MQAQSSGRTKTFTIGFQENEFDESANAAAVARHLGTDHTQLIVTAGEAMSVIPRLSSFYDEPFGDSSAIPTFLVSRLAREHVKVSLSGDGGDELFGGYARYQRTNDIWQSMRRVPLGVRRTLSLGARAAAWRPQARVAHGAARVARYLEADSGAAVYTAQLTQRHDIERLVLEGTRYAESLPDDELRRDDLYSNMMFMDATRYLPDDILVKVDRASMAVGLEGRVPMLDHRVVELAWRLPLRLKVRDRTGKWILREILRKYVPDSVQRPGKRGFGVPIGSWVRGPLKDWAESLLDPTKLRQQGVLDVEMVRTQWDEHLHQDSRHSDRIWHVLAFQAWMASVA